jgi:hypothetical protein
MRQFRVSVWRAALLGMAALCAARAWSQEGGQGPVAVITGGPYSGNAPLAVYLDATGAPIAEDHTRVGGISSSSLHPHRCLRGRGQQHRRGLPSHGAGRDPRSRP